MTEADARAWAAEQFGAPAVERLSTFAELVAAENVEQNLIAPSTVDTIWVRHLLDSAQLVPLAPAAGAWVDVGTGGGFPGMVIALLRPDRTILVEPRKRRAAFLEHCATTLALSHVEIVAGKVETVAAQAAVISARAVASVENLFLAASGCATVKTRWLLPRGRFGEADLTALRQRWRGEFHVEQSLSDAASSILVAERVSRR